MRTTGGSPSSTPACTRTSVSACCAYAAISRTKPSFLANYADGLSDLPLDQQIADFERRKVVGSFASVRSAQSFHLVQADAEGLVTAVGPMRNDELYINGGFFAFRHEIFDYIQEGEELVEQPFARLIAAAAPRNVSSHRVLAGDGYVQGQDHLRSHGSAG